jgi:hypothetical protein
LQQEDETAGDSAKAQSFPNEIAGDRPRLRRVAAKADPGLAQQTAQTSDLNPANRFIPFKAGARCGLSIGCFLPGPGDGFEAC